MIEDIQLIKTTQKGRRVKVRAKIERKDGRIWFRSSPFALKDEIKAMKGSKWHGFEDPPRKIWSVEDCQRNDFNLRYMMGEDVFAHFDQEIQHFDSRHPLMGHQFELANAGLTYHYQIWAAEMGVGKTLAAQQVIELSNQRLWYWVGPKTSLPNIRREFQRWDFPHDKIHVELMTYDALYKVMENWEPGQPVPGGLLCDESTKVKNANTKRARGAQKLADMIRDTYGFDGFTILMSGTPSPKTPVDWWSQAEIAWPGFLKEGSDKALEKRLSYMEYHEAPDTGVVYPKRIGWKDDEGKCDECGAYEHEHTDEMDDWHEFTPSVNEVAMMYERLEGLVVVKHKKDCLQLPDKRYRKIHCKPKTSTLRVAKALTEAAESTIKGLEALRELSDGFQYREKQDGTVACKHCEDGKVFEWFDPNDNERVFRDIELFTDDEKDVLERREIVCPSCHGTCEAPRYVRETVEVPCPKDDALKELLDECDETGRIVIFAGFQGSVDRIERLCREHHWAVVRVDGRGWQVTDEFGERVQSNEPLDYWEDMDNPRVAFVAHPESGGMSFTLTQSRMAVFWSNSFKPEYRGQAEDRIHRKGMDENLGCVIVDLIHLPSDERVLSVIQENRRLELMTLGEFTNEDK